MTDFFRGLGIACTIPFLALGCVIGISAYLILMGLACCVVVPMQTICAMGRGE